MPKGGRKSRPNNCRNIKNSNRYQYLESDSCDHVLLSSYGLGESTVQVTVLSQCPCHMRTETNPERNHTFESNNCDNSSAQHRLNYMLVRSTEPMLPSSVLHLTCSVLDSRAPEIHSLRREECRVLLYVLQAIFYRWSISFVMFCVAGLVWTHIFAWL